MVSSVNPYQKVNPLDYRTPIVDPTTGTPTDQFTRLWLQMFKNSDGTKTDVTTKADKTIQIIAGTGLIGGGTLASDRTLTLKDTAVTPGTFGSSTKSAQITVDQQGRLTNVAEVTIAGGGGGGGTPTVKASNIYSGNASSYNLTFPTGAAAGDVCFLFGGHGYGVNRPTGWLQFDNLQGGNFNGGTFAKILSSGDITTGYVNVTTDGGYYGVFALVLINPASMKGTHNPSASARSAGGISSAVLTNISAFSSDLVLFFGGTRGNANVTFAASTSLNAINATEASGAIGSFSGGGTPLGTTDTISFSRAGLGYYVSAIALAG